MADKLRPRSDPNNPNTEEIARHYSAAMDSVNLINSLVAKGKDNLTDDEKDTVKRNVDHLKIMVAKTWWIDQDLTPLNDAIADGEGVL